jgi:hypothetical protein
MIKDRGRLFDGRILFFGVALVICATSFLAAAGSNSVIQVRAEVDKELAHILSVVQVKPNPELTMEPTVGKGGLVTSPDRKYSAYILCLPLPTPDDPERCAHRVHFEENTRPRPATISQIRGEEELQEITRPVDSLKWVNNFTLSYERWAQPHFGHRYVIDVRSKKQVTAYDLSNVH